MPRLKIIIRNSSIEGWLVTEGRIWTADCKQTIGLALLARFHYIIYCFLTNCRKNSTK